jgi:large subunit ribosomal protein L11
LQKANISKGSAEPNRNKVGVLTWDAVKEIAASKMEDLNTTKLESAMKMVAGTARSMGVTIQD